jgi:hypothetical protein
MPTKWNPLDAGAGITFANNNLTAFMSATSRSVRSTTVKTTGKWYFECTNFWFGGSRMIGVMLATATLNSYPGSDADGFGLYYSSGWRTVTNNTFTNEGGTPPVFGVASIVGVCVDLDNDLIYATNDGANIVGDPTALTGGKVIPAGAMFAATGGTQLSNTTNFGATGFAFGPPSGFTAWDTSPFIYESFDMPTTAISVVPYGVGT